MGGGGWVQDGRGNVMVSAAHRKGPSLFVEINPRKGPPRDRLKISLPSRR